MLRANCTVVKLLRSAGKCSLTSTMCFNRWMSELFVRVSVDVWQSRQSSASIASSKQDIEQHSTTRCWDRLGAQLPCEAGKMKEGPTVLMAAALCQHCTLVEFLFRVAQMWVDQHDFPGLQRHQSEVLRFPRGLRGTGEMHSDARTGHEICANNSSA